MASTSKSFEDKNLDEKDLVGKRVKVKVFK